MKTIPRTMDYWAVGKFWHKCHGRVVTASNGLTVVNARNCHDGRHDLVLVDKDGDAVWQGTDAVLMSARVWLSVKAYRRIRRFLADRNIAVREE